MVIHREIPCHESNYARGRTKPVTFLVVHYVGAEGTAKANANYYGRTAGLEASAHYFVGHGPDAEVWQSVAEEDTAWHVGARRYVHPVCRNANSIGVELCCRRRKDGGWQFDQETVERGAELCREIAGRYGIPQDHVLRHYDVTGKVCPAPFVQDEEAWKRFLASVFQESGAGEEEPMRLYTNVEDMPDWAREAAGRAVRNGYIRTAGDGSIGVWEESLQPLVWMDRAGLLDDPARR